MKNMYVLCFFFFFLFSDKSIYSVNLKDRQIDMLLKHATEAQLAHLMKVREVMTSRPPALQREKENLSVNCFRYSL